MLALIVILTIGALVALIIFNQLRISAGRRQAGRSTPVAPWRDGAPAPLADSADDPITRTLESLRRVDDHPLYTMTYYGAYGAPPSRLSVLLSRIKGYTPWACSLFVAFADSERAIYG